MVDAHWSGLLMGYQIQNPTRQLNGVPLRWMPRVGHPWRKHFCDARFIVMELDTSMLIILVMSWNTSTTAQVWLSWFRHKIVMDVHAWQKMWPTVTNMYHHGSVFFCLGTAYDVSSMESVVSSKSLLLVGKVCLPKCFYLSIFALSSGTSINPYFPPWRAFLLLYAIFIFYLTLHLIL